LLRNELKNLVTAAVGRLVEAGTLSAEVLRAPVEISDTKTPEHGDYACNFAMVATKLASVPPRQVGEKLRDEMLADQVAERVFEAIEIAGPGFVNFRLKPKHVASFLTPVLEKGTDYAKPEPVNPQRINVEFVSVNPNGPITIGSGRGAAFGSTLCNVLAAAGHVVHREYYINDGVNSEQMRLFAESVKSYAMGLDFPEKGYRGEYVKDVAAQVGASATDQPISWWQGKSQEIMLERQKGDLEIFGVDFDTWFSEQSLHDRGEVEQRIAALQEKGVADDEPYRTTLKLAKGGKIEAVERVEQPNEEADDEFGTDAGATDAPRATGEGATLWLRSTKFGDDMDRVLRRKDGRLTYIASDVSYHADKFNRPQNADKLITILGPDHHGYIGRLHAVLAALLENPASQQTGTSEPLNEIDASIYRSPEERDACRAALEQARESLEVVIYQIVRFLKDGKPAPMRKRDGNIYELRDLVNELGQTMAPNADRSEQQRIGRDVARFFYLTRSHDTHMDFDIDLATKQSEENPVFYAQYAHARICSVLKKAEDSGLAAAQQVNTGLLTHPRESTLIKKILDLPMEVARCAEDYGVHRLTTYAVELARTYHHFYDACRVVQADQTELSQARLALCQAAKTALKATFDLLGVSAPERMERTAEA
jgi:arginyl-tRNA synthetase